MTALQIQLPEQLHQKAVEITTAKHLSLDMVVAASLAQWLARIVPDPYLEARARRSTGEALAEALAQVPDAPPEEYDRLEE